MKLFTIPGVAGACARPLLALAVAIGATSVAACAPSKPPSFVETAERATKLTVYAAPSRYPTSVQSAGTSEPTVEVHGELLFAKTLTVEGDEAKRLAKMLVEPGLFRSHVSGKKCGGFHADYAVEWPGTASKNMVLLCFGCGEARSVGEGEDSLVDLSEEGRKRLEDVLQTLGKRR